MRSSRAPFRMLEHKNQFLHVVDETSDSIRQILANLETIQIAKGRRVTIKEKRKG